MTESQMEGFGYKTGWLAIRDGELEPVLAVLDGQPAGQVDWSSGIARAYDETHTVVATPPLEGADGASWLLITGWWIASHRDAIDIAALSADLDREVQLFVSHRIVELHRWERACDGVVVRSFEYVGEVGAVQRWHGTPDVVELDLGLPAVFDLASAEHADASVNESDVMRVAAAWSVDPASLDGQPATGMLSLIQLPVPADSTFEPDRPLTVIDITDLIVADEPYEVFIERLAERHRDAGLPWDD